MKKEIKETLDSKGKYRCVRFDTGEVGMVDEEGNALMVLGQWDRLKFSTHGFLKITNQVTTSTWTVKTVSCMHKCQSLCM